MRMLYNHTNCQNNEPYDVRNNNMMKLNNNNISTSYFNDNIIRVIVILGISTYYNGNAVLIMVNDAPTMSKK